MPATPTLLDIPPYRVQHLVSNVKELLGGSPGRLSSRGTVEVCCAQALGSEIYVGCSEGSLLRYVFVDSLETTAESYQLLTHQALPSGHAIEQIVLAPGIEKALVLSDHQIHFFTLPNLEPMEHIKPIRHVVTFALDDTQQRRPLPERRTHQPEVVSLCVIKRTNITVYNLGMRLQFRKELPLPNGAALARLSNRHLCIADHETYNVVDIESTSLIPLLPLSQAPGSLPVKPSITVITESEFLLLSWTGSSTLGVFITGTGDPVRGTLTWDTHPVALCCEYPYLTSLLSNGTVEVHSLESQTICQILEPPTSFFPISLERSFNGYVVPLGDQKHELDIVDFSLLEPDAPDTSAIEEGAIHNSLKDPQTPPRKRDSISTSSPKKPHTRQPKAGVLAIGANAVYSLATPTLIQQTDVMLEGHKLKEVSNLAKEHQKRIEQMKRASQSHSASDVEAQSEEILYMFQRVGYKCLSETLFEEAGNNLFRGDVDPRLLIRLFPGLRGTLLSSSVSLPVFYGLLHQMHSLTSVDTIIKNYTPHLQPNTRSAPPTSELRKLLMESARNMLREYLRKWKNKVLYSGEAGDKEVNQAVDTILAKLHAESEETQDLYSLIESSNDIIAEEVEETLIRTGQYNALLKVHQRRNDVGKLLEILSKLVEGEWSDEDIRDPLEQMKVLLNEERDRAMVQRWGLWLVKQDPAAGLKLLMSGDGKRSSRTSEAALLSEIEAVSVEGGQQFLEYLVLQKHSNDPDLHTRLAHACLDRLISALHIKEVFKFFKDSALEYAIQGSTSPFLTYLVTSVNPPSSMYEHVRTRSRAVLFLQGSTLYDVRALREKLVPWDEVLGFEVAILDGKLGKHLDALTALVHVLRDTASADVYCALGGCAVSPKTAQFVGEQFDLQPWAALLVRGSIRRSGISKANKGNENLEETRRQLLKVLLKVYMSGGEATEEYTARLLNSQGGNLDVLDVLSLVPSTWPLDVVSSFLARSLRQSVHDRCEGEILKAVCLGQNLEVRDSTYIVIREQGAVIEEAAPGTQTPPSSGDTPELEEGAVDEKKIVVVDARAQDADVITVEKQDIERQRLEAVETDVT